MRGLLSLIRGLRGRFQLGEGPRAVMLRRIGWYVFLFMVAAGLVLTAVNYFSSTGLFVPRDAAGILRGADGRDDYQWTSQAVHTFKIGDSEVRQDSVRVVVVSRDQNRFSIDVSGALPDVYRFQSDGTVTLRNTLTRQRNGQPWQLVNNVCEGVKAVPAELATMPSGEVLAEAKPRLIESDERFQGEKVWVMEFTPTPAILKQMLLMPLLTRTTTEGEQRWALSNSEEKLIDQGDYKVEEATVVVSKTNPRAVAAIDVRFTLANGRSWHLLSALRPDAGGSGLDDLNLGKPNC